MLNKRIVISGLIINSLTACSSSPMELPQPKGDWEDFEPVNIQPARPIAADNRNTDTPSVAQRAVNASAGARNMGLPNAPADKDLLIAASGYNVPLYKAVRTLVPPSWNVKLSPDVAEGFKSKVSWVGNDQWPYVLRKSMNTAGLEPVIDEQQKSVLIRFAKPVKKAVPTAAVKNTSAPVSIERSSGLLKLPVVPVATPPFKQSADKTKPFTPPLLAKPAVLPTKPAAPVTPALKAWKIAKGTTLRQGFESWIKTEHCPGQGGKWSVRWDSSTDYPIDYPLTFNAADFEAATAQLFNLYQRAQVPLYVSGYRQQCLIVISDRK